MVIRKSTLVLTLALALHAQSPRDEVNLFADTKKAVELMRLQKYEAAAKIWKKLIKNEEEYSIGYNNLGLCQMNLGVYVEALDSYNRANDISANIDARAGRQWALLALKRYDLSIIAGEYALKLDPENYWVHVRLAAAYNGSGQYQKAQATYAKILAIHGSSVKELYNIGVANRQAGNRQGATHFFTQAYKKDASHAPTRTALGLYPRVPNFSLLPYFGSYRYRGTQYKGRGQKLGAYAMAAFDDYWYFGGGYFRDTTENLKDGGEYKLHHIAAHFTRFFDNRSSFSVFGHYLSSNETLTNNGVVVVGNFTSGDFNRFSLAAGGIFYSQQSGFQISPSYLYNVYKMLWLEGTAIGQLMASKSTTEQAITGGPPPPPGAPPPTQTVESTDFKAYGGLDASVSAVFNWLTIGGGGRFGTLLTPYLLQGSAIVYNPDELKNGLYAFVRIYPIRWLHMNFVYAYDEFSNSDGEKPISNSYSVSMTIRLP